MRTAPATSTKPGAVRGHDAYFPDKSQARGIGIMSSLSAEAKERRTTALLPPGIEQLHSEIVHIADISGDQGQFVYKRSCGEECNDDRP
jgi:hypothetical protein